MSFFVAGKILQPGQHILPNARDYHHNNFSIEHTKKMVDSGMLNGLPFLWDHRLPVGKIITSVQGKDGCVWACGKIDTTNPIGELAAQQIESGQKQGLSLTGDFKAFFSPGLVVEKRKPLELSNVDEPMRPDCWIAHHWRTPKK